MTLTGSRYDKQQTCNSELDIIIIMTRESHSCISSGRSCGLIIPGTASCWRRFSSAACRSCVSLSSRKRLAGSSPAYSCNGGREEGREGWREGGREGEKEGAREAGREGVKERHRKGKN